jgi:hypothetical protein
MIGLGLGIFQIAIRARNGDTLQSNLETEDGFNLLLENGFFLLLEG